MKLAFGFLLLALADADTYLNFPRGSNNRLNEQSANRNNGNRLFDSQNNNRGGYNAGDFSDDAAADNQGGSDFETSYGQEVDKGQYRMMYYEGSKMQIEWTQQHGCGGEVSGDAAAAGTESASVPKSSCNMVLQYTCDTTNNAPFFLRMEIQNGDNTDTPNNANDFDDIDNERNDNDGDEDGRHEGEGYYWWCENRPRNANLFTADQKLDGDEAIYTRQNPNGNRNGLECPEERDYYPYWLPTPWADVAYLTSNYNAAEEAIVKAASGNVKAYAFCDVDINAGANNNQINNVDDAEDIVQATTQADCNDAGGTWRTTVNHNMAPPAYVQADFTKVNHLGNTGATGEMSGYEWTVPTFNGNDFSQYFEDNGGDSANCVFRIRYNMSSLDFTPDGVDASQNNIDAVISNNPTVDAGTYNMQGLTLALNTAQIGRTFQDRSHAFIIKKRPNFLASTELLNLNVRGKRGNIVQTFPAMEYNYVPDNMQLKVGACAHLQWTGSNTHNNGNPAGDGQAGDAGEGTGGTDRHNFVLSAGESALNYPAKIDTAANALPMFDVYLPTKTNGNGNNAYYNGDAYNGNKADALDAALYLATGGECNDINDLGDCDINDTLNNVDASLQAGAILCNNGQMSGKVNFLNTRNNNFSNRSQKGVINLLTAAESAQAQPLQAMKSSKCAMGGVC